MRHLCRGELQKYEVIMMIKTHGFTQ